MSTEAFASTRILASARAFLLGKAISAPLSLALVLVLAMVMPRSEYASYVAAVAILEIGIVVGTCGMEWLTQTAIAGIRVRGNATQLRRAIVMVSAMPFVPYVLLGGAILLSAPLLSRLVGDVATPAVIALYGVVLVLEGPGRMVRDQLLSVLMLQVGAQVAVVLRVLVVLGGVGWLYFGAGTVQATHVAMLEIAAATVSLAVSALVVIVAVRRLPRKPGESAAIREWFGRPAFSFAFNAYTSFLLLMLRGPEVMTALIAKFLGADVTAAFGFVTRLVDTARRYLPMDLFYGVIRPATIGRFESGGRDTKSLMTDANRMINANLIAVGVCMAVALGVGGQLLDWLDRGRLPTPDLLLPSLLTLLIGHSLLRVVELLSFVQGHSALFVRCAILFALVPLGTSVALTTTASAETVPLVALGVDVLMCACVIQGLRMRGFHVDFEYHRWLRMLFAVLLAASAGSIVSRLLAHESSLVLPLIAILAAYLFFVLALRVVSSADVTWAQGLLKRSDA